MRCATGLIRPIPPSRRPSPPPAASSPRGPTSRTCVTTLAMRPPRRRCRPASFSPRTALRSTWPTAYKPNENLSLVRRSSATTSDRPSSPSATSTACMPGTARSCGASSRLARENGLHSDGPHLRSASRSRAGAGPRAEAAHDDRSAAAQPWKRKESKPSF